VIGKRLKLARAAAGFSLRGLQAAMGNLVTAQAIGKYERDESMPGSDVLIALSRALNVTPEYLASDADLVLEDVAFRRKVVTRRKEEARIEGGVLHFVERYLSVEAALHLPSREWSRPRGAPFTVREAVEAEQIAEEVRRHWGLGTGAIQDLAELLEERGIKVLALDLVDVDGLTAYVAHSRSAQLSDRSRVADSAQVPVVVVNARAWGERQRFTMAHELGHLVIQTRAGRDAESAAHRFAGAFLVPAATLRAHVGNHRSAISRGELLELKKVFGVSAQALAYRCRDLEIISSREFRRLFRDFSRLGWRTPPYEEPFAMKSLARPRRFERLCYRALAEGAISETQAAELLGLTVRDVRARMAGPV